MEAGGTDNQGLATRAAAGAAAPAALDDAGAAGTRPAFFKGLALLPRNQQIAVLGGVALAIALAVAVVLWSQSSDYSVLFSSLPDKEVGEVMDALTKLNIPHKVDSRTGSLQVPSDRLHEVRLKLAAQGMPKDGTQGFELMDQERGFGTSQMMETARYQRAWKGKSLAPSPPCSTSNPPASTWRCPRKPYSSAKRKNPAPR